MSGHPYKDRPVAATHVWLTPRDILESLGPFDLDPCAAPSPRPWPTAVQHIEPPQCGLSAEWHGRVWLNPPFGDQTWPWVEKLAKHGNGIALTFARTETVGFQDWIWAKADAVMFLRSRPYFRRPDGSRAPGNSGGPICLSAFGENNVAALERSGLKGAIVRSMNAGSGVG